MPEFAWPFTSNNSPDWHDLPYEKRMEVIAWYAKLNLMILADK